MQKRPVADILRERVPRSLELALLTILIALVWAVPLGVVSAVRQNTWADYLVRVLSISGLSLPIFFTGVLVLYGLVRLFGWLPPLEFVSFTVSRPREPEAAHLAGARAGVLHQRADHATHALATPRGDPAGLCADGAGQGARRACGRLPTRAHEFAPARRDLRRLVGRPAPRRHRDRRDHLLRAGNGLGPRPGGEPARLPRAGSSVTRR